MSIRPTTPDSSLHLTATCAVCGGSSFLPFGSRADGVAVVQCERCRMAFVERRPADPMTLYGDRYYRGGGLTASGYDDYEQVAAHSLAWAVELVQLLRPGGRILDVGCADGHLLRALGPGYEAHGVEVHEPMLAACAEAGIRMLGRDINDPLLGREWSGRFDVITAIAVLEHLPDLRGALQQLRQLLAPDGVLIFETPLMSPTRDNGTWYETSLEHIFYPTLEGLDFVFREVFSLPLIGREVPIRGYASTFVGVATRRAETHHALAARFHYLVDTPIAALEKPQERCFRFFFDVVHAAQTTGAHASVLEEIPQQRLSRLMRRRLGELWRNDLERSAPPEAPDAEAARVGSELKDARQRVLRATEEARRLRGDLATAENRVRALLRSTSWRLTAPWRWTGRAVRAGLERSLRSGSVPWRLARALWRLAPLGAPAKQRWITMLIQRGVLAPAQSWRLPAAEELPSFTDNGSEVLRQELWPNHLPLVSVVIPCFDYGTFVAAAVDSILAQTFQDLEIIVVDGGSENPESIAALRPFARPKTTVYWRDGPHQVGDNRNFGVERARGKYICCLDADDLLRPTYLEKALFLLEGEGYDVVSTSYEAFGDDSSIFALAEHPTLVDLVAGNQLATCAVFRRGLWEQAGGFRDAGRGVEYVYEDWRLWIRFAALGARILNIVGEPLFVYRVHASSLSRGETVRPIASQRQSILALEGDVVNEAAYAQSRLRRGERVTVERPLLNLERETVDRRPTVLIAAPFLLVGGQERLLSMVVAHLERQGFRIVITTSVHFDPSFGDSTDWFTAATAEIYHLPRFLAPSRWRDFVFYLLRSKRVQLLWIAGSSLFYELLPEIKAEFPAIKVIDSLFNTVGHTANNRRHSSSIDLNLVENHEVESWLLESGESRERVRLIASGVDLDRFRPASKPQAALRTLGIPPDAFVVGFSGRLAEEKRPHWFVKIAQRLRGDRRLVFLMTGAGPLELDVRERIARLGLEDRLHFMGRVPDVRDCLSLYDVLVLPSRFDGRPVVVLESLAMGVPVIASRVGGLPGLIRDGETGFLCDAGNRGSFVDRIRWLADHRQEHRRMKVAARRFAEEELSATRMLADYERAVRDVLGLTPVAEVLAVGSEAEDETSGRLRAHRHGQAQQLPQS